jgi:hypothetical protein
MVKGKNLILIDGRKYEKRSLSSFIKSSLITELLQIQFQLLPFSQRMQNVFLSSSIRSSNKFDILQGFLWQIERSIIRPGHTWRRNTTWRVSISRSFV